MGRECAICNEDYNEDERCPRSLPCSHTLCSQCIGNLISRKMNKCPYCSRNFHAGSVRDIGINTEFLDMLKLFKEMELKSNTSHHMSASSSGLMEELMEETQRIANELLVDCQKADQEIDSLLQSKEQLQNAFSEAAEVLSNIILPNVKEMVTQNINRASYMEKQCNNLESQKEVINEKRNQIMASKTKSRSAKTFSEAGGAVDEVSCMKTDLQKTFGSFMEQSSEEEKTNLEMKKVAETTKEGIVQLEKIVASAAKDGSFNFVPAVKKKTIPKSFSHEITIESLVSRDKPVLDLMRQGKVFASLDIEGSQRFAQLSLNNNKKMKKMLLHCLREQIPPPDASLLKHQDIMKLFTDSSSKYVFLNFGTDEKSLGRIYISLKPNLKKSQNFWVLCTGEIGPSYLNSNISEVRYKGSDDEQIVCGDYDGTGGKALIPGIGEAGGVNIFEQRFAGSVLGFYGHDNQNRRLCYEPGPLYGYFGDKNQAAKFVINMHDNDCILEFNTIFGKVESNLHILKEAISQYQNISEVKITDCGIMIPI